MIINKKYKKWEKEMQSCFPENFDHMQLYFNWEIIPEDVEILINLLMPNIFEYKNLLYFSLYSDDCEWIKNLVDTADSRLTRKERQESINIIRIRDIFFNNNDDSSNETINNIAKLIKHNWEYYLQKRYPDRKFIVEISGETCDPDITFYEID